jgi:hypothetical protein
MNLKIYDNNTTSNDNIIEKKYYQNKYNIFRVNNVLKYEIENFNTWTVETSTIGVISTSNYYLIIDTFFHDAFGHWVFESAIYLKLFLELKKEYPNLKLHLKGKKKYKVLFVEYFGINIDDIVYNLEPSNTCIFPLPISCLNIKENNHLFREYVDDLFTHFSFTLEKEYNILLSPRGRLENYKNNDRIINTTDIENNLQTMSNTLIMYTDELNDLKTQIDLVKKTNTVVITDGSPFMVNGMFAKNSKIILLGDMFKSQMEVYQKNHYIFQKIAENNEIIIIPGSWSWTYSYNDIKYYI